MVVRALRTPLPIPSGIEVVIDGSVITAKTSKATLQYVVNAGISIIKEDNALKFAVTNPAANNNLIGTARALVSNMFLGLSEGFERKLVLMGVGYRAQVQGKKLALNLGLSHPVNYQIPDGITIEAPSQTELVIKGTDKRLVGQVAAEIRAFRPPEPYKGKGVRYADERIILKEGKKK